ncbi:hypothetical protein LCGC14_1470480, partial [marine sediment metagenome]
MKVIRKQVRQVSPQIYRKLHSLNYRDKGDMQWTLQRNRVQKRGTVHYILDGDRLIGWSLLFSAHYGPIHCHIYVRKNERRKGYGRRLLRANVRYTRRLGKAFK